MQGLEAEIEVVEQERAQAVGSHVEGMDQLFRLQAERLDGIQQTFNKELEVPPPDLCALFPSSFVSLELTFLQTMVVPACQTGNLYLD